MGFCIGIATVVMAEIIFWTAILQTYSVKIDTLDQNCETNLKQAGAELCQTQSSAKLRAQLSSELSYAQSSAKLRAQLI